MSRIRKERLSRSHHRAGFDCGVEELNSFLRNTARRQDERHLVRTTVLVDVDQPERILAYYSTAPCEIANHSYPIPFLRMARLASDGSVQGRGFGELALLAAIDDAATISRRLTAIGGLVVDAKDQRAAALYEKYDFVRIERAGLQFFMPIQDCVSLMDESMHQPTLNADQMDEA